MAHRKTGTHGGAIPAIADAAEAAGSAGGVFRMSLPIDPATLSTAQQKRFDPRSRRFFTSRKVAAGMRAVAALARPYAAEVRRVVGDSGPVELGMAFCYPWPRSAPRRGRADMEPMAVGADCDNRAKAPIDALSAAGWWDDDRRIARLVLAKVRTVGDPRMEVAVRRAARPAGVDGLLF